MAYYLEFLGSGNENGRRISLQSRINIQSGDDFSIFMDVDILQNINWFRPLGGDNLGDTAPRVLIFGGGRVRLTTTGGTNLEWFTGVNLTTIETLEFRRTSGTLELLINGTVQTGTKTSNADSFLGFQIINGNFSIVSETPFNLYRLKFTINGTLTNDYSPSASNGTGLVLPDIAGGNNGTLVNFPGDNSQWVFYNDGGAVVSTAAATWPLLQVAANQQSTAPAVYNLNVSLTWPMFAASANQQSSAPVYESALSFGWPMFQVSVAQSNEAPVFPGAVSFNWPMLQVAVSQAAIPPDGAGLAITWPLIAASAAQSNTVPVYSFDASFNWPMVSFYADGREFTPEPDLDLQISNYGHNKQWKSSVFFER